MCFTLVLRSPRHITRKGAYWQSGNYLAKLIVGVGQNMQSGSNMHVEIIDEIQIINIKQKIDLTFMLKSVKKKNDISEKVMFFH